MMPAPKSYSASEVPAGRSQDDMVPDIPSPSGLPARSVTASGRFFRGGHRSGGGIRMQRSQESVSENNEPSMRDSIRNSVNIKTMSFLRKFVGQRNQEYVSDVQMQPSVRNQRQTQVVSSIRETETIPERTIDIAGSSDDRKRFLLYRVLNARLWRALLIFFTFILLFGAQFRDLFIPKAADPAIDAIFVIAFLFFTADMIFRVDAEFNYFHLYLCNCVGYSSGVAADRVHDAARDPRVSGVNTLPGCCGTQPQPFQVGSFLFFCDLISTIVLLREISFVMPKNFEELFVNIELDEFGLLEHVSVVMCVSVYQMSLHSASL